MDNKFVSLLNDISWKFYDGSESSQKELGEWFVKLAYSGEFSIHPKHNGNLKLSKDVLVVLTPLGLEVRK